jgi:hypothetical protein
MASAVMSIANIIFHLSCSGLSSGFGSSYYISAFIYFNHKSEFALLLECARY